MKTPGFKMLPVVFLINDQGAPIYSHIFHNRYGVPEKDSLAQKLTFKQCPVDSPISTDQFEFIDMQ